MSTMITAAPAPSRASSQSQTTAATSDGSDFARELQAAQAGASASDRTASDRTASDRAAADRSAADRSAADRAAARRDETTSRDAARRDDAARKDAADRRDEASRTDDASHADESARAKDADKTEGDDQAVASKDENTEDAQSDATEQGAEVTDLDAEPVVPPVRTQPAPTAASAATQAAAAADPALAAAQLQAAETTGDATAAATVEGEPAVASPLEATQRRTAGQRGEATTATSLASQSAPEGDAAPTPLSGAEGDTSDAQAEGEALPQPAPRAATEEASTDAADQDVRLPGARTEQTAADVRPAAPAASTATTATDGAAQAAAPAVTATTASSPTAATAAAAPTAQATPPLATQLTGQLAQIKTLPQGEHTLTLSVTPETFGTVKVVAHITQDGVSLQLFGATDASREALKGALADLRRDLAATGLTADLDLGTEQGPQGQLADQGTGLGSRRGSQQPTTTIRVDGPEPTATLATPTATRPGGVDVMI